MMLYRKTKKFQRIIRQQVKAIETVKHACYDPELNEILIQRDINRMRKQLNRTTKSFRDFQITAIKAGYDEALKVIA